MLHLAATLGKTLMFADSYRTELKLASSDRGDTLLSRGRRIIVIMNRSNRFKVFRYFEIWDIFLYPRQILLVGSTV